MKIPEGFGTVAPYLFIDNAADYVEFLEKAFDCEVTNTSYRPDDRIANCQVRFGDTTIMLSESSDRYKASRTSLYLYVADADAAVARAIDSGATLEMAVMDMPYGDRQGGVVDPAGIIWWISQRLTDEPYC